MSVLLRRFDPRVDLQLVKNSWCKQIRPPRGNGRPCKVQPFSYMTPEEFARHSLLIDSLLYQASTWVACSDDCPEQAFGYVCGDNQTHPDGHHVQVLHMVYVRSGWRRRGIADKLLIRLYPHFREQPIYYTHSVKAERAVPRAWRQVVQTWKLRYNPYNIIWMVPDENSDGEITT